MKKIFTLLITLLLVLSVGACNSAPQDTDLEERIATVEKTLELQAEQIEVLEQFYQNVVPTVGLNGQTDYYVNYNGNMYLSLNYFSLMAEKTEKDYLDKTKFPSYIWDENDDYISIYDLGNLLSQKYFGVNSTSQFDIQYKMKIFKPDEMSKEEYIVRLCMMIIELSNYDFYTIDSTTLYIEFIDGGSQYMKARMTLLVNDDYNLHPAIFWHKLMDTRIVGFYYEQELLNDIYQGYIDEGTFDGYVLPNYK